MPGSGQVEQVTVRFQADINQYIQAIAQATKAIQGFATGAEGSTAKAMNASVKVAQQYSKIAQESGKLAVEQTKVAAAADKAAVAHDRLNNQTSKSVSSMGNMGSALRGVIGQYISLGIAISQVANVVKEGMDFNSFMEVSTTAFGVMMKSVDGAKAKMKELFDYAVASPLTFKDTVSASRQLMAYGFTANQLIPTINTLGIVAKATGVQLGDMAYVYGTLKSQGRAYTRDLMQFAMRGIPIYEELAKVVGKPVAELQKMTEAGKIGFAEVEQAFKNMTTGTGRFAGFFDEYMKTYEGKMSMLTDVYQQATGKLTAGMFEALKPAIDELTVALQENGDAFASWGKVVGEVVTGTISGLKSVGEVLRMLGDAFIWLVKPLGWIIDLFDIFGAFKWDALIIAIGAIVAVINPVVGAVILLSEAIVLAAKAYNDFMNSIDPKKVYAGDFKREDMRSKGVLTQNSTTVTIVPVVDQVAKDEAAKELEKMMDEFNKYADRYKKFQAEISGDRYAMVNYEFDKEIQIMEEKLAGNKQLQDQSRKWLEEERNYRKMTIDLERYWKERNAIEAEKTDWKAISKTYSPSSATTPQQYAKQYGIPESAVSSEFMKIAYLLMQAVSASYTESTKDIITHGPQGQSYTTTVPFSQSNPEALAAAKVLQAALDQLVSTAKGEVADSLLKTAEEFADTQQKAYDDWKTDQGTEMEQLDKRYEMEKNIIWVQLAAYPELLATAMQNATDIYNFKLKLEKKLQDEKERQEKIEKYNTMTQGDPAFWESNKVAAVDAFDKKTVAGNLEGAGRIALNGISGTEMGSGQAGANPLAMMVEAAMKFLMSIENVVKVLNPFTTILEGARAILEPLINNALQPLVDYFMGMGEMLGQVLSPFINMVAISLKMLYAVLEITVIPVMQMVGAAFAWFNDYVIVPIGNGMIDIVNGVIGVINTALGFLGVHIKKLEHILTTTEKTLEAQNLKMATDALSQTISFLTKRLNDAIDSQIQSYKDLYEVGAMSATEYASKSSAANASRPENLTNMVTIADQSLSTSTDILARLTTLNGIQTNIDNNDLTAAEKLNLLTNAGLATTLQPVLNNPPKVTIGDTIVDVANNTTVTVTQINALLAQISTMATDIATLQAQVAAMAVPPTSTTTTTVEESGGRYNRGLAVGTPNVPYDMPANIHKGEGIIPATFMDSIRKGDLSLSGGGNGGGSINVTVNVAGSVRTERDLATSIATEIYRQRRSGLLTV